VIRRAVIAAIAGAVAALVAASGAGACSCARIDARERLQDADAAVIGTALRSEAVDGRHLTHLQVERGFKADLGAEVVVDTGREDGGGGDCSIKIPDGRRVGLFLYRNEAGVWASGLCGLVDPDELERGAGPVPEPLGRGTVALVAAIGLDGHRLAALDARGRLLAYGRGRGRTFGIDVCPGARRLVELVAAERRNTIVVRRLPDLGVVRTFRVPTAEGVTAECMGGAGRDVLVLVTDYEEPVAHGRVLRYRGERRSLVHRGTVAEMAVSGRTAYVGTGRWGREIVSVDLGTRARRHVATVPRIPGELVVSPDGRALATVAYNPFGTSHAVVIRPGARPAVRRFPIGEGAGGRLVWTGRNRLLYGAEDAYFRLFDGALRTVRRSRRHMSGSRFMALRGRTVFGIDDGELLAARLPGLRVRRLAHLPSIDVFALAAVSGAPRLQRTASSAGACRW
jgi:hypothetical protein